MFKFIHGKQFKMASGNNIVSYSVYMMNATLFSEWGQWFYPLVTHMWTRSNPSSENNTLNKRTLSNRQVALPRLYRHKKAVSHKVNCKISNYWQYSLSDHQHSMHNRVCLVRLTNAINITNKHTLNK